MARPGRLRFSGSKVKRRAAPRWRWWVASLFIFLTGLAAVGERSISRFWSLRGEVERLQGEIQHLEAENEAHATRSAQDQAKFEQSAAQIDQSVQTLKSTIGQWENELKTLRARVTVSTATVNINKQLAQLRDVFGTCINIQFCEFIKT